MIDKLIIPNDDPYSPDAMVIVGRKLNELIDAVTQQHHSLQTLNVIVKGLEYERTHRSSNYNP